MSSFVKKRKTIIKLFIILIALCIILPGLTCLFILWQVNWGNTKYLEKTAILSKIREETIIYYLDEKTQIGSLFNAKHRRYTPINEIPQHVLDAVVAAEDKNYYKHIGVDILALSKAFLAGVMKGGRFTRGGSTITQQTVKNIVNDWEPSFARKFREMIRALQLETLYDKYQILEFYLNQFYVANNGNGIGIAAKYYFNKEVQDLTLIESAFIAGSLKGPSKYNPFIKYTLEAKEKAKAFAMQRKNYVLHRMYEQKWVSHEVYKKTLKEEVPFNKGNFTNSEIALVTLLKKNLEKKEILDAIGLKSIKDLNIAGYKIYSTINKDLQLSTQLGMRQNLSRVETILNDFSTEPKEKFKKLKTLEKNMFVYGKVESVDIKNPNQPKIKVSFGYPKGTINHQSIIQYAKLLNLADRNGYKKHLKNIIETIQIGDILFCEVINYDNNNNEAQLKLSKRPSVSGGLIAIDKGEVRAIIAGFDTLGYNRALFAKRQPGSLFKTLVFFSSLQLGWSILDPLDNIRKTFPYQGNYYIPRPDHKSSYETVSLLWTGVMSENLASISLVSKLLDKINFDQFKKILDLVGLLPMEKESERDYHYRLSRETGVSLGPNGIKEFQLTRTITEIIPDLIFSQEKNLIKNLKQIWWGKGYENAIATLRIRKLEENKIPEKEIHTRIELLENNFLHLEKSYNLFNKDWDLIQKTMKEDGLETTLTKIETLTAINNFRFSTNTRNQFEIKYFHPSLYEDQLELSEDERVLELKEPEGNKLEIEHIVKIWSSNEEQELTTTKDLKHDVKLHGYLTIELFEKIKKITEQKYQQVIENKQKYLLKRYFQHHDFRIALGLAYISQLAKECGIYNKVEPVLSLPLGTSDLTVGEIAKLYQTFIEGKTYSYYEKGPINQLSFIRKIEDRFGNVLYEPQRTEHQIVENDIVSQIREILRKTMSHGTGRQARRQLYLKVKNMKNKIFIPSFGKTGTTNDFTTSYFAGSIPYPTKKGAPLNPENNYTIVAYIGYDNNKYMKKGYQKIYGASGALPLWIETVKKTIEINKYSKYVDPFDLTVLSRNEWPLSFYPNTYPVLIDLPRGLILREGDEADKEIYQTNHSKNKNDYYQNIFVPDLKLNSVLYIPKKYKANDLNSRHLSLFKRRN